MRRLMRNNEGIAPGRAIDWAFGPSRRSRLYAMARYRPPAPKNLP